MQTINTVNIEAVDEARRQLEICNACRYCESYCSVFPAVHRQRSYSDADIKQLANLCHNCRGCYYACQYTAPHEFNLNLPQVLASVRTDVWQDGASPGFLAKQFHRCGTAIAVAVIAFFALLLLLVQGDGEAGFYSLLSHNAMVGIFMPAFILPIIAIVVSVRNFWRMIDGDSITLNHLKGAVASAAQMKNLAAGHGDGCNFEDEDRFSNARRYYHQATMYGFLLCFAATSVGTLMHYLFDLPAPYDLISLPKLFGVTGGILLSVGTLGLAVLKYRADRQLADIRVWGGEMAFVLLLFAVSTTGLLLWVLSGSTWLPELLALHLGTVLAFFLLMPYSKMVHGFYRLAALIREEQLK